MEAIDADVSNTIALEIELARIMHETKTLKEDAKKIRFKEFKGYLNVQVTTREKFMVLRFSNIENNK